MKKIIISLAACGALTVGAAACGNDDDSSSAAGNSGGDLSGTIRIDGSSTVAPFAQAAQEAFQGENPDVRITVGTSGTGGGFEKFCAGETDISTASRPIKDDEEVPVCEKAGVKYSEVQVANDGIAVVSNPDLKVDCLTTDQLKELWNQGSKIKSLSEIDPKLPDTQLSLFGFSYYEQNQDKLNLIGVDGGDGCVKPSTESIQDGSYTPLGRPLFMYPSAKAIKRPEVKAFMDYVVENYQPIAEASQIVPMSQSQADKAKSALGG